MAQKHREQHLLPSDSLFKSLQLSWLFFMKSQINANYEVNLFIIIAPKWSEMNLKEDDPKKLMTFL